MTQLHMQSTVRPDPYRTPTILSQPARRIPDRQRITEAESPLVEYAVKTQSIFAEATSAPREDVLFEAAKRLAGMMRDCAALEAVLEELDSPDPIRRALATRALGYFKGPDSLLQCFLEGPANGHGFTNRLH